MYLSLNGLVMSSKNLSIAVVLLILVLGIVLISSDKSVSGVMEYCGSLISQIMA